MTDRFMWRRLGGKGGGKCCFVCLSPPHDSQSLPALWTKCKAGGTELELTLWEKMVAQLKGSGLWVSVLLTSRSAVKLSPGGRSSGHTLFPKEFPLLHSELTCGNHFTEEKNKLSQKTFYCLIWRTSVREGSCCCCLCLQHFFVPEWRTLCFNYLVVYLHTFSPHSANSLNFIIHIQAKEYSY